MTIEKIVGENINKHFQASGLNITHFSKKISVQNGKIVDFVNAKSAANHYASAYSTIARNCQSDAPIKSGALKGYKFERIS